MLAPLYSAAFATAGMLSVDGRCKTLDARANGYARSEAVGVAIVGKGDGTLVLGGSAVRQDGRSASLTAPNGSAQRTLLVSALDRASLHPVEVGSLEAHGTGTALGDPTEAGALVAVRNGWPQHTAYHYAGVEGAERLVRIEKAGVGVWHIEGKKLSLIHI